MTVVLDTTIFVDWLRGDAAAVAAMRELIGSGERIVASVITRTELLAGLREREREVFADALRVADWIPVDAEIADRAGEFAARFVHSHAAVDLGDYYVAATAEMIGARVWTSNLKHFPMFPELRRPY